jgi:hypothetical protein
VRINVLKAASLFFPSSSLETVYFEAVANSIDANASNIWINITIDDFNDVSTFKLEINDNGDGFTDYNFTKFSNLLEVDEETHKGIGRLVFLNYFKNVEIISSYENKQRHFLFNEKFNGESHIADKKNEKKTTLTFTKYNKSKIAGYNYLIPYNIKESILNHFYPLFYKFKIEKKSLNISITLTTSKPNINHSFFSSSASLDVSTIPDLLVEDCDSKTIDFFAKFKLYYSIKQTYGTSSLITAICVDERTLSEDIISKTSIPFGYEMIFLLNSDYFKGKSNIDRNTLNLDDDIKRKIKRMFVSKVSEIINKSIPEISERNKKVDDELNEKYPHLHGYFEEETIGLIEKDNSIEIAQNKFLKDQKDILEASSLDDVKYEKYLEVSSRLLTEYILYRNLVINKLKKLDYKNDEGEIHNLIVPKRKIFRSDKFMDTIFSNNAWLLDDKYMSYTTILSDQKIRKIYNEIDISETTSKKDRKPDITIIFSGNPEEMTKVDVVIVELKRLGLEQGGKEYLVSQLRQRARVLLSHYPNKIQRIWFYGIVDIDNEFRRFLLEDEYIELYSPGTLYYKQQNVIVDGDPTEKKIPWGLFVQSYNSFVNDAEIRNSTFLKILKESIKKNIGEDTKEDISSDETEVKNNQKETSHAR